MSDPGPPPPWGPAPTPGGSTAPGLPPAPGSTPAWSAPASASGGLSELAQDAVRTQVRVDAGRRLLRMVGLVAGVIWLVAVLTSALAQWHVLSDQGSQGVSLGTGVINQNPTVDGWQLIQVIADALDSTWGYALVAVGAFGASLWFDDSRARDLFELLDEDDEPDEAPGA